MVGSAALVSAMAGDVKKAAQMLDTLAPEVGHAFPTLPAIQLHPTLCLYAHILHKTRPLGHPMPINASSPLRHYWAHRDSAKLPGTLVEQMSQTIRKEVFVFWRQCKISFCIPKLTVPLKCALHLQLARQPGSFAVVHLKTSSNSSCGTVRRRKRWCCRPLHPQSGPVCCRGCQTRARRLV